jgi:hypothetical protein
MNDIKIPEAECLRPYFRGWSGLRPDNDNPPVRQADIFTENDDDCCMEGGLLTFY